MGRGGAYAYADDQGSYDSSIQHSLAKAICDGCMKRIFMKNQSIDLDQSEVTKALLHESGIYERTHRHSRYKKKNFLEWVSIHYASVSPLHSPDVTLKKLKLDAETSTNGDIDFVPEQKAYADDQGSFSTCTRHALGKALCDGYELVWFDQPKKIDFLQKEISNI